MLMVVWFAGAIIVEVSGRIVADWGLVLVSARIAAETMSVGIQTTLLIYVVVAVVEEVKTANKCP